MKCDVCLNSRPIISESGVVYVCTLSSEKAVSCLLGKKDYSKTILRGIIDDDRRIKVRCACAESAKKNEIGEEIVWCRWTGRWMNVDLGECYGNCESEVYNGEEDNQRAAGRT